MKFRKILCLLLALVFVMLCLAGCRKDEQESTVDQDEEATEETTEQQEFQGLNDLNEPMEIELPDGVDIESGGDDFDR